MAGVIGTGRRVSLGNGVSLMRFIYRFSFTQAAAGNPGTTTDPADTAAQAKSAATAAQEKSAATPAPADEPNSGQTRPG